MIDFHNHVLPGVDDGPELLEESLNMLRTAAEQGITDVVNTVHFQHPKMEGKDIDFESLEIQTVRLQNILNNEGIDVRLHLGAEVYFLPNLVELTDNPLCTFGNGKYMLVEFPFHMLPKGYDKVLFNLILAGTTPIIAHPERCEPIQRKLWILSKLVRSGCLVQVDGPSVMGILGNSARVTAMEIIERGLCHLLGSDAHNDDIRNFSLVRTVERCKETFGDSVKEWVTTNPEKILKGEKIEAEIQEAASDYAVTFWKKLVRRFRLERTH